MIERPQNQNATPEMAAAFCVAPQKFFMDEVKSLIYAYSLSVKIKKI